MSLTDEDELLHGESDEEGQKEEEAQEEEATERDQIESCPLTQDMMAQSLSLLCRTGNGLAHAFVKADLKERSLTDIALLSSFVHLRFLDISSNFLTDFSPLAALTQLLWLKADGNQLPGFRDQPLGQLAYLQWLSLAANRLGDTEGLGGPALESLNLTGNGIQRVSGLEYHRLTNLVTLELRGNSLETTDGIYLPNLRNLYLAQNKIKQLEGLEKLERLTTLHLRGNQLETLDGLSPSMKSLQYLNIRDNLIASRKALQSLLGVAQTLQAIVLTGNPFSDMEDYRLLVLTYLPLLERLDKEHFSSEERMEAQERIREFEESTEQEDQ
ncbi:leucine-rich repeat-containing protein 23 [Astyanax mexicanus]|uniref:Leucine-rich repeat-containing protein 23 n=2 Tax=Astyanax mexicanus TaxID=7994 RepID=A0A8B9LJ45_ASTMX|nr:leucine-rich repeat-containing protein 23 [Astyanax mexicanus]XP_022533137.1 leucine-rich repeat-containing protein 23 [Astyanax mexicanus]KAG9269606.1 leucine-rich repeat-containing protein 23 [Astyanax mexicanus]